MAFRCILDVVVFLEKFRNLDLYQQGLYCVRVSLSVPGSCHSILPYECYEGSSYGHSILHCLIPPRISEDEHCFDSCVFLIRYTEEEAIINERTTFRVAIDYPKEDFYIDLDCMLLYSELDGDLDPTTLPMRISLLPKIQFKVVSSTHIRLNRPHLGVHTYLPVVFDETHRCIMEGTVHAVVQTFLLEGSEGSEVNREEKAVQVAKVLFVDKQGQPKQYIGAGETDTKYREYVGLVAQGREALREFLSSFLNHPLPSAEFRLPDKLLLPQQRAPDGSIVSKFSEAVSSHNPVQVCISLLSELSLVSADIYQMCNQLRKALRDYHFHLTKPMLRAHIQRIQDRFSPFIIQKTLKVRDQPLIYPPSLEPFLREFASERRSSRSVEPFPLEKLPLTTEFPVIYQETYEPDYPDKMTAAPSPRSSSDEGMDAVPAVPKEEITTYKDVFILVHGFQGRAYDVHLLKQAIVLVNPDAVVLSSSSNETSTEGDITAMGLKLASEVRTFILEWCSSRKLGRLSFIGHSLGGLIIRAAIPHLTEYAAKMHLFMTFSTPHLGYTSASSRLIDAGMWLLRKWKRSAALQQLSFTDDEHIPSTALYNLSDCAGLRWFQYVVFCSSIQDQYVPHDSARVEIPEHIDPNRSRYYQEMAGKLLSQVSMERLYRLDVTFPIKGKGFDTLIGRTAHIQFLESETFLEMLVYSYPEFFSSK